MKDFAKMNEHEEKMLNIWMNFWAENEGETFEEWLNEQVEMYSDFDEEYADLHRQALAEWLA